MIPVAARRIIVVRARVDFRKHFDGLLGVAYAARFNPYDGDCVVFVRKDRTQMRALIGDQAGLYLLLRRFDAGRLPPRWAVGEAEPPESISPAELQLLLEGSTCHIISRMRPRVSPLHVDPSQF